MEQWDMRWYRRFGLIGFGWRRGSYWHVKRVSAYLIIRLNHLEVNLGWL